MLEAMIKHYTNGNKSQMAKMLGVSSQCISSWLSRDTFDQELIYAKCDSINPGWLLSGIGSMLLEKEETEQYDDQSRELDTNIHKSSIYYNMYKEERAKVESQAEQIGALKQTIRQLEEKIEEDPQGDTAGTENDSGNEDAPDVGIADVG